MNQAVHISLRILVCTLFSIGTTFGYGQGLLLRPRVSEAGNYQVVSHLADPSEYPGLNEKLLIDAWKDNSEFGYESVYFGLRFNPVNDRNVYLLYNHKLENLRAIAEVGFSMNYFNALTLKYTQSFSLSNKKNKSSICLK